MAGEVEEKLHFVVQHHSSKSDHYDFRIEWEGRLLSLAIPKGPSYDPKDKRLAVRVEDHPLEHRDFEGVIPEDEYGGVTVTFWDEGYWEPRGDVDEELEYGDLKMVLYGKKLKSKWVTVKMNAKTSEKNENWLLIKEKEKYAKEHEDVLRLDQSVRTNRNMDEITHGKEQDK